MRNIKNNKKYMNLALTVMLATVLALLVVVVYFTKIEMLVADSFEYNQSVISLKEKLTEENIDSTKILYNFDGRQDFLLVNFKEKGYAIFCRTTAEPLQINLNESSVFREKTGTFIYSGPGNYFLKNGEEFIVLGTVLFLI